MNRIREFIKKETVFTVAWILAILSMFIIPPNSHYIEYIDFRTLAILFSLMSVMAGLKKRGFFSMIAKTMIAKVGGLVQLEYLLVMLCFFFSMLITNDVALITFVPLALAVLAMADKKHRIIPVVVMQTIGANLGSMITPIGNPQNLYLYSKSGITLGDFLMIMLPYGLLSLLMIGITLFLIRDKVDSRLVLSAFDDEVEAVVKTKSYRAEITYLVLFVVCVLTVARFIPVTVMLLATLVVVCIVDYKVFKDVDYILLLTFVGFFVFVGNMGRIPEIAKLLEQILTNREVITSVFVSQVISNVPAAILLSGFTENYKALMIGTNLGGLGTLIASMASLISYKYVAQDWDEKKGRYLLYFTAVNIIFLIVLLGFFYVIA